MAGFKVRRTTQMAVNETDEPKCHLNHHQHKLNQLKSELNQVDRYDSLAGEDTRQVNKFALSNNDADRNNNNNDDLKESIGCQASDNFNKINRNVTSEVEDSSCKQQQQQHRQPNQPTSTKPSNCDAQLVKLAPNRMADNFSGSANQSKAVRGSNGSIYQRIGAIRDTKKRMKCNDTIGNKSKFIESHKIEELVCSCNCPPTNSEYKTLNTANNSQMAKDTNEQNTGENPIIQSRNRNSRLLIQPHVLVSLGERNGRSSICNKHMPWFGIDVGGSLVKVVFFDPKDASREETMTLKRIRRYLKSSKPYGLTGRRDAHLEMPNCTINKRLGTLHFIRFATSQMPEFLEMVRNKRFADTINTVCATGGGACKFEQDIKKNLGITLHKTDELDSIIYGIHYIDKCNPDRECYFLQDPLDDQKCVQVPYDFSSPYPYLVVNIGSGVSILAVYSSTSYSRISGSSIGGGTFLGLCCLLTQCKTFDEAIRLAKAGSSSKIDKLVKDIYGGDYPKFNLSGDTVASSFGHMNMAEKRENVKREDLARALLEMVTINIGSIARMCAANENIDRVVFIGNFLRVNQLSMKLLSYAVNYWSKGAIKALFLEHEGYFGAVGCFVESTQGCSDQ